MGISLKGLFDAFTEQHKETLLASVKEAVATLKEECIRLEKESGSDPMDIHQQTARHAQEIQDCKVDLEDWARSMHAQHVREINELKKGFEMQLKNLKMGFEMQLENQKLEYLDQKTKLEGQGCSFCMQRSKEVREQEISIDTLILSHDEELEKFRKELGLSKGEIALQSKEIFELNDKLLDKERALRAQEVLNSTSTRPRTMPSKGATTIAPMPLQASSKQQDTLSSSFSRYIFKCSFVACHGVLFLTVGRCILNMHDQ